MKGDFFKIVIMLIAISLLMALTSCGTKIKIVVSLVGQDFMDSRIRQEVLVERESLIKGSSRAELYLRAVNKMKEGKVTDAEGLTTAFKKDFRVNNVTEDNGTAVVDFSSKNLSGSETVEKMLISQIVNTLIKSFDEIQAVSFTVDGDEAETLMSHVDITRSFSVPIL